MSSPRRIAPDFREGRVPALGLPGRAVAPVAAAVSLLSRLARPSVLVVAGVAGACTLAQLVLVEYPFQQIVAGTPHEVVFVGLPGLSFAIVIAGDRSDRDAHPGEPGPELSLTALGGLVVADVVPFELSGPALVTAWAALATVGFVVEARLLAPRIGPLVDPAVASLPMRFARPSVVAVASVAGICAIAHLVVVDYPLDRIGRTILSSPPYAGPERALPSRGPRRAGRRRVGDAALAGSGS